MALAPKQSGQEILRRFVPLNTLGDDAMERLLPGVQFEKLAAGDTLFHEGDTDHFNIYLLSGRVVLQSDGKDVDTVDAGSNTARFPLAHQIPRKYRAMAKTRVEIARVDNRQLGELLAQAGSSAYEVQELEQGGGDWMSQLLQSRVFQQIPAANIQSVMMRMQEHRVKEGECIIRQGEDGDYFYLINQGRCSVLHQTEGEKEAREVAQLGPGDSFGEEALLSDRPRGSTVIMLSDGVLLRLSKDDFIQFVKRPLAREIEFATAQEEVEAGAHWLDVRSAESYAAGHLPNAISLPFGSLRYQAASLDPGQHYIVYCENGQQSASAAYLLVEQGFQVSLLVGGLAGNREAELQAEEPPAEVVSLRPEDVMQDQGLARDTDESSSSIAELQQKIQAFERKAQEQLRGMKKLKLALDKAKVRIRTSESHLAELQQARDSLIEERDGLQQQLERLQEELAQTRAGSEQLQQARDSLIEERDGLQQQLERLQEELAQARAGSEQAQQEQEAKLQAVQAQLTERESALQTLQTQLAEGDELEQSLAEAQQARDSLAEERDGLQQQLERLQEELTQARAGSEQAQQEQEAKLQAIQAQLTERESTLEALQTQLAEGDELQQSLAEAQQARDSLAAERDGLQQQLERLQEELAQARAGSDQAQQEQEAKLQAVQAQLTERESALEALQTQLAEGDELEQSLAEAQQARDSLIEERDGLQQQLERLQEELAQVRADSEQAQQEQEAKLQAVQAQLTERESALEALQTQLAQGDELQQSLAEAQQARDSLIEECDGLQQQLEQLQQEHAEGQRKLEELQEQLSDREQQLEALQSSQAEPDGLQELRRELEEVMASRAVLEAKLNGLQQAPSEDTVERIRALEAELETLTLALEESDKEHDRLKAELQSLREVTPEPVDTAGPATEELEQAREALQLKEVELEALRSELDLVRERSEQDIREMRQALEQAEARAGETTGVDESELQRLREELEHQRLSDSADAAENEALKQDLERLQKVVAEREDELEKMRRMQLRLEEELEDGHSELDELKRKLEQAQDDAEEAEFRQQEADEARKQLEQALYRLQEELERKRGESQDEIRDPVLSSGKPLDLDELSSPRRGWVAVVAAALVSFVLADGLAIVSGKGELISGLLSGDTSSASVSREPLSRPQLADAADSRPTQNRPEPVQGNLSAVEPSRADSARLQLALPGSPSARPSQLEQVQPKPVQASPEPIRQAAVEPGPVKQAGAQPAAAAAAASPKIVTGKPLQDRLRSGGTGPEMVVIASGEFTMGSDRSLIDLEERPAHRVAVSSFAMAKTEVTFNDYKRFAEATGRQVPDDLGWGSGNHPVINVSWDDANAYARWLSQQSGATYRLPSEAEWEFAAAAGNDALYWWGYDLGEGRANCFNCGSQWDGKSSAPVGSFEANPYGLHDMLGNVMEWVNDCYHPNYQGAPSDGSSWITEGCRERVVRGGAFNKPGKSLRVTRRGAQPADARLFSLGFRVVRELP